MKIYHRIVGDPPQWGFGVSLITPGFPQTTPMGNNKVVRLAISEVPYERKAIPGVVQLIERHRAFEVQPMAFGHLVAIHSAAGCMGAERVHSYSDFALPMIGEGVFTDTLSAWQLLAFDRFMSLEDFWQIDNTVSVLPVSDWQPPADGGFQWSKPLPQGFREALLAQYWRAATQSIFGGTQNPVRVCLGEETDCLHIIEEAKAFFSAVIATGLPRETQNIMSMSAPVPSRHVLQSYPGSALAFLYPTEEMSCDFDLRTGHYRPSSNDEVAMITHLLRGGEIRLRSDMLTHYQAVTGHGSAEHCPFMADFDIALAAFRLENGLVPPEELPRLWYLLGEYLAQRHGLGQALAEKMLVDVDGIVVRQLLAQERLPAFALKESRLLLHRALTADGPLADAEITLLARHQAERQEPFIGDMLLDIDRADTQRTAKVLAVVLERGYVEEPLDLKQRDCLASEAFSSLCKSHEAINEAMTDYVLKAGKRHPENTLFMLPLAMQYLNGQALLTQTLDLLRSSYVDTLPDDAMCKDIRASWGNSTAEHDKQLQGYYVACIRRHIDALGPLQAVIRAINVDAGLSLRSFFAEESANASNAATPLTVSRISELFSKLVTLTAEQMGVYAGLLAYVDAVLAQSFQAGQNLFDWLSGLRAADLLRADAYDERGIPYVLQWGLTSGTPPQQTAFQALLGWLREGRLQTQPGAEEQLKALYETCADAGKTQLWELLAQLRSTKGYPYLASVHGEYIRKQLLSLGKVQFYWNAVDSMRADLDKAGLNADAALAEGVRETLAATLDSLFRRTNTVLEHADAYETGRAKPADGFQRLWNERLGAAFRAQYDALLQDALGRDIDAIKRRRETSKHDNHQNNHGGDARDTDISAAAATEGRQAFGVAPTVDADSKYQQFKELGKLLGDGQRFGSPQGSVAEGQPYGGDQASGAREQIVRTLDSTIKALEQVRSMPVASLDQHVRGVMNALLNCRGRTPYVAMRQYLLCLMLIEPNHRQQLLAMRFERSVAVAAACCLPDTSVLWAAELLEVFTDWPQDAWQHPFKHREKLATITALFEQLGRIHPLLPDLLSQFLQKDDRWTGYAERLRADRKQFADCFPWLADAQVRNEVAVSRAMRAWLMGNETKRSKRREDDFNVAF